MIDLSRCTFIIPVSIESKDRLRNTIITLSYLLDKFKTNIILKETGPISIYKRDILPVLDKDVTHQIEYIYECTNDSVFHRTRHLNEMLNVCNTPIVVNYDVDVLLPIESYVDSCNLIRNDNVDLVYPYTQQPGRWQKCLVINHNIINEPGFIKHFDPTDYIASAKCTGFGHCQFYKTSSYISGGMENENFISYGPEDFERNMRFKKLGYDVRSITGDVYHIEHERGVNSSTANIYMSDNENLYQLLNNMDINEIQYYYDNQQYIEKYKKNKPEFNK